jgi:hypothetical protein
MTAQTISEEIAALELKAKSAKTEVVKKALNSKIDKLQVELAKLTTQTEAKEKLYKAKAKVRSMSATAFNAFIDKLSAKQGYAFLKQMSDDEIKRDVARVAKPVGWRYRGRENMKKPLKRDIKEGNNVYYENRVNKSDVSRTVRLKEGGGVGEKSYNNPEKATHVLHVDGQSWFLEKIDSTHFYISNNRNSRGMAHHVGQHKGEEYYNEVKQWLNDTKMAKGGFVGKGEMVWKKLRPSQKAEFLYKNFTPEITPRSQEILVGKAYNFLPKNVKVVLESQYANVEDYAKGGDVEKFAAGGSIPYVLWVSTDGKKREFYKLFNTQRGAEIALNKITKTGKYKEQGVLPKSKYEKHGSFWYEEGGNVKPKMVRSIFEEEELEYGKGGNVPSIAKKVAEVNALIERANELNLTVTDTSGTWQAPMKYKPFKYINGTLYEEYQEMDLYKHNKGKGTTWETKKGKTLKSNMQYDSPLNDVARMYRKALKQHDTNSYAKGGMMADDLKKKDDEFVIQDQDVYKSGSKWFATASKVYPNDRSRDAMYVTGNGYTKKEALADLEHNLSYYAKGGSIDDDDNLLSFTIPTWALSSLVNADDSGLEDEDIEKLNEFVDRTVSQYGNANFLMGSDEDMEAQFTYRNDIDGTLGGDVVTMYLRPNKMAYGGGIGSYKKHTIGDTVEVYDFGGKTKIMKIIGFEDGRETYILESEDGKSRSYTPKKYIANLSGEFPYLEKEKMAKGGGVDVEYVLFDNYTYKKISEHKSLRSAKMAMDKMMDKGTYEEIGIKPKSEYEKLAKATFGQMAKGGEIHKLQF